MSTPEQIKACCAAAYSSDAVTMLLGDSYHPGGTTLTRRLAALLELRAGQRVIDVACGPGATARLLASEYGVSVDGVDLAAPVVREAQAQADGAGLGSAVRFHVGDAERLPLPDNHFDALITECAFCTFPDKPAAVAEFARVLRPGGRIGLADVTTATAGLSEQLTSLATWVACVADARPLSRYRQLLGAAGLAVIHSESRDEALIEMIDQIEARLHLLRMSHALANIGIDADAVLRYIDLARHAVTDRRLGYALLVAEKR